MKGISYFWQSGGLHGWIPVFFWGGGSGQGKLVNSAHQEALERSLGIEGQSSPMLPQGKAVADMSIS